MKVQKSNQPDKAVGFKKMALGKDQLAKIFGGNPDIVIEDNVVD